MFYYIGLVALFLFGNIEHTLAQQVLPFPPTPSASEAGPTMQTSTYKKRVDPKRLPDDAPNILIILIDDVGPATPSTYGGEINTPNLSRIADLGIGYNRFHSTAMCSPTRASLLTGRNHTGVANGQIAEIANDWAGFSGTIPKTSATIAEVLKNYGYNTSAFGKWHNTPAEQTTSKGPFEYWPAGYGFEYFYGFLAGEASQYEPQMVRNTTPVKHPETTQGHDEYHLTEDITDDAILWLREQQAFAPDKPFFMYWAPGAVHGPHQVNARWADKYKGKFDDGWDAYRERAFKRQKELGWIPQDTKLTARNETMTAWKDIPESQRPFQIRLMELFAGFAEHTDYNVGLIFDELEAQGRFDNTIVFYIWGDNGSSAEGQDGSISELLAQNGIPTTVDQQIEALNKLGGLDVLGTAKTDNMYNAGWAWAGSTPYKSTKLIAAHFGGTRQPMAISWPKKIKHDNTPRPQFHHVIDIVPTIYEITNITPPLQVNGFAQDPIDGVSMEYTFADPLAKGTRNVQFFDIMGSRGVYYDGWFASAFGIRSPWLPGLPAGAASWNPENDTWELYNIDEDWSQANDLSKKMPEKLQSMKDLFLVESAKYKNLPIGGGLWSAIYHPEDAPSTPYTEWTFSGPITRMPEFTAPKLGKFDNNVSLNINVPENASGVLYSLGGFSGGLTCYVLDGYLCYEYNLFEIERTKLKSKAKLPLGDVKIEVVSRIVSPKRGAPLDVTLKVDGKEVAQGQVPITAAFTFTANDCLDFGSDLGSPVSTDYFDIAPFPFNGTLGISKIWYPEK
ncbi:arylsulfatase [Formosa sp. PL04]|uniref:arylsulfatase n=1 Tax=Formosa sp. PL04 TaxID=3081755 RepID=UPI002982A1B7|nr:arylsulfatase [Formosa sp. PL04]MDW5288935.1 arylsulfatase [Formosa sp. PL04]